MISFKRSTKISYSHSTSKYMLNANSAVATQKPDNVMRLLLIRAPTLPQSQQDLGNDCLSKCVFVHCDIAIN